MAATRNSPGWSTKPGEARDFPVLLHGNVATPGEIVPRHFPAVLAKGDGLLKNGSGRLELAEKIFTDAAPLAARVIVNRVWGWHFGRPLVATPSDFGVQGEKPTHPELLDDLAARFIAHGWSLEVAQSRDHAVGGVPAIQPAARGRGEDRSDQLAVVANESAAPGCGILSRYAAALCRPPERQDVRAVRRRRSGDQRAPHGVLRASAAGA